MPVISHDNCRGSGATTLLLPGAIDGNLRDWNTHEKGRCQERGRC